MPIYNRLETQLNELQHKKAEKKQKDIDFNTQTIE